MYIDREEREKRFRDDWNKLLDEHGAEAEYDHDTGILSICMYSKYNIETDKLEKDFCEFDL
jgi:hypothetical protein